MIFKLIFKFFIVEGYIYTAIDWINEDTVSVIWMNRVQNQSQVTECRKDVEMVNIKIIMNHFSSLI